MDMSDLWKQYNDITASNLCPAPTIEETCSHDNVVYDTKNGFNVCIDCGDTLQSTFDESAEWTNCSSDQIKKDPARCGCPSNPLLEKSSMSTMIKSNRYSFMSKLHHQMSMDHVERSLFHVFEQISRMACDNGNLSTNIIEQAKYYYKIISERKLSRGDIRQGLIACCILYACKFCNVCRSVKEIANMCDVKLTLLNKTHKIFIDKMHDILEKDSMFKASIDTIDMIPRYCNSLSLNKEVEYKLIRKVYLLDKIVKEKQILDGKTPSSIACGMIVFICKLNNIYIDKKRFVAQHNISVVTINKVVKNIEMYSDVHENLQIL